MKKVKLPRKRKKAYIKAHSLSDYRMMQICLEILLEEGKGNDRFYTLRVAKNRKERLSSMNGYIITKRW